MKVRMVLLVVCRSVLNEDGRVSGGESLLARIQNAQIEMN